MVGGEKMMNRLPRQYTITCYIIHVLVLVKINNLMKIN